MSPFVEAAGGSPRLLLLLILVAAGASALAFGFLPALLLRLSLRCYPPGHERREELAGDFAKIAISRRPAWAASTMVLCLDEGLSARRAARSASDEGLGARRAPRSAQRARAGGRRLREFVRASAVVLNTALIWGAGLWLATPLPLWMPVSITVAGALVLALQARRGVRQMRARRTEDASQ